MPTDPFKEAWLKRFGLTTAGWRKAVSSHVDALPFVGKASAQSLIEFLFNVAPEVLKRDKSKARRELCDAFGWCCFAFWQCESAFPSFPENYAEFLQKAILSGAPSAEQIALARMITERRAGEGQCGFNRLALANPQVIRESETLIHEGRYEFYLRAREKYDEYEFYLLQSEEFRNEWNLLKELFPKQTSNPKIINRSLLPERNWVRGNGAEFKNEVDRFQALFDFFCWKYYLWGMEGDTPLLLKTSVVFTPYGTQLFIPGYLSLDPKRDLDFAKVTRLHRARGIARQGPGFSIGRREFADLRRKAKAADRQARENKLKGEQRYRLVCEQIGFRDGGDYRRLRKLLQKHSR